MKYRTFKDLMLSVLIGVLAEASWSNRPASRVVLSAGTLALVVLVGLGVKVLWDRRND